MCYEMGRIPAARCDVMNTACAGDTSKGWTAAIGPHSQRYAFGKV